MREDNQKVNAVSRSSMSTQIRRGLACVSFRGGCRTKSVIMLMGFDSNTASIVRMSTRIPCPVLLEVGEILISHRGDFTAHASQNVRMTPSPTEAP